MFSITFSLKDMSRNWRVWASPRLSVWIFRRGRRRQPWRRWIDSASRQRWLACRRRFYFGDAIFTQNLVRQCNEESASLVASEPTRFGVFAGLPLPDVESTLKEIEYAMDTLQLDGICHFSNYDGIYLAWTIATGSFTIPGAKDRAPQGALAYMKRYYYDTGLCGTPFALRTLQEFVEPSQILYATDFPFCPEPLIQSQIQMLQSYDGFDNETLQLVERGNALSLFPRIAGLVTE